MVGLVSECLSSPSTSQRPQLMKWHSDALSSFPSLIDSEFPPSIY